MRVVAAIALLLAGCAEDAPPRAQALMFVDTDLPSPRLADRVRITVLRERDGVLELACEGCEREVAIASEEDWPLSFGVEPRAGDRLAARAVAFLTGRTHLGDILPETAVATTVFVRFDDGIATQELFLSGTCAGIAEAGMQTCREGALAPITMAETREPGAPSRVGTFRADYALTCTGAPRDDGGTHDGEACVRGGTYWMGDVRRQGFGGHVDAVPEHLVTVSPFFLDRHEYTVGRYRAALMSGFSSTAVPATTDGCTFRGAADASADDLPLVCVTSHLAEALCEHEGRRLPTEAEREWAAGALEEEWLFPWGNTNMLPDVEVQSAVPVGSRPWDTLAIGGRDVVDLGWNVVEWVADYHQTYIAPCWLPGAYGPDPRCDPPPEEPTNGRSARGGYWRGPGDVAASYRPMVPHMQAFPGGGQGAFVGFRCARDDG